MKLPVFIAALVVCLPATADEGMWLFNSFPSAKVRGKYGIDVSQKLLDHLRLASVRVGASGSFVSPNGLIFTNHHVVLSCVQNVSTAEHDYVEDGFYAKTLEEEKPCPGSEANVLMEIQDVTAKVKGAVHAVDGSAEAEKQRRGAILALETECSKRTGNNCQMVTLYGGAQYHLYRFKKYTDIRLVFAPEYQIGFFGGDPDNFTYPRYCLDIGFFRVYENGKPASTPEYLRWSASGVKEGEVIFVSGNPGTTERLLTMAQLEEYRDAAYPLALKRMESAIAALNGYMRKGPAQTREAKSVLFGIENSYKARRGHFTGLNDAGLMGEKRAAEQKLRAAIDHDPVLRTRYAGVFDQVAKAVAADRPFAVRRGLLETPAMGSRLASIARTVLRLPEELAKPEDKRLREYGGSALRSLENRLYSAAPIHPGLEKALLAQHFRNMVADLGESDATVKAVLAGRSPEDAAAAYVDGSKLIDVAERKRLAASREAVAASKDTMIELMRMIDPEARRLRAQYEDQVEAVLNAARPKLAEARFAVSGPNESPDATFSLRLSYGRVKGYEDGKGRAIPYATRMGDVFKRATGELPYVLPASWLKARDAISPTVPFDFVSTADIIGGNSGSPTVNADGEIVGIVFDGNIESLPGNFAFTENIARAVHVSSQAIVEALTKVYRADRLAGELQLTASPAGR